MSRLRLMVAVAAESDMEIWSELGLRHKLNERWRLSIVHIVHIVGMGYKFSL